MYKYSSMPSVQEAVHRLVWIHKIFVNIFIQNPDIFTNIWQLIVDFRPLSSFYNSVYIFGLHMREGDWTRGDTSNIYSQRHRGG